MIEFGENLNKNLNYQSLKAIEQTIEKLKNRLITVFN